MSEVNPFKYTVLSNGTVPLFINDGEQYNVPEDKLTSFINYYGDSSITAGVQYFVPETDDLGSRSYGEYIIPSTDREAFTADKPDAMEGFVYGDNNEIFSAIKHNKPYRIDDSQKTAVSLYLASYDETGKYPETEYITNLAKDVDEKYDAYLAEIESQGEKVTVDPTAILDKFQFYHQNNPEIVDGKTFTGEQVLSEANMQTVIDWVNGQEINPTEKKRLENNSKTHFDKIFNQEITATEASNNMAFIVTGKGYDELDDDEKKTVDFLLKSEDLDQEYNFLDDTEKFQYMYQWKLRQLMQQYNQKLNPNAKPKVEATEATQEISSGGYAGYVSEEIMEEGRKKLEEEELDPVASETVNSLYGINSGNTATPAEYYTDLEIMDMAFKDVMVYAFENGWDGAINLGDKGALDWFAESTVSGAFEKVPWVGGWSVAANAKITIDAVNALKKHNIAITNFENGTGEDPYDDDGIPKFISKDQIQLLDQMMLDQARGSTWMYDFLDIVSEIPAFGAEMYTAFASMGTSATVSGASATAKAGGKVALKQSIKEFFSNVGLREGLEQLAKRTNLTNAPDFIFRNGKWLVTATGKAAKAPMNISFWSRFAGMAYEDYNHANIASLNMRLEDGTYYEPKVLESVADSYRDLAFEIFSEMSGQKIMAGASYLGRPAKKYISEMSDKAVNSTLVKSIASKISEKNPEISEKVLTGITRRIKGTIDWFHKKYAKAYADDGIARKGFLGGPIEEMSEEQLIKVMNLVVDKDIESVYTEWKSEKELSGDDASVERFLADIQSSWLPASLKSDNPNYGAQSYLGGIVSSLDNVEYNFPTWRELTTQFAAFSVPGMVSEGIATTMNKNELDALVQGFEDADIKSEYVEALKLKYEAQEASPAEIAFLIKKGEAEFDVEKVPENVLTNTIKAIGYLSEEERMQLGVDNIPLTNKLVMRAINTTMKDIEGAEEAILKERPLTVPGTDILDQLEKGQVSLKTNSGIEIVAIEDAVDTEGNPVIAHYNVDNNTIEINVSEAKNLAEGIGTVENPGIERVIAHEEAHSMYERLNENEKEIVTKMYDALPEEEKAMYEEKFPTEDSMRASEWYAEQWQQKLFDKKDTSELDTFFDYGTQSIGEQALGSVQGTFGEGMNEVIEYFKELDPDNVQVYNRIEEVRTLMDEVNSELKKGNQQGAMDILSQLDAAGDRLLDETTGKPIAPEDIQVKGSNQPIIEGDVIKDIINLYSGSNPGTIIEERAETWYKRQEAKGVGFNDFIARERASYEGKTGEQSGESDLEWFSTLAKDYAFSGKTESPVSQKLLNILKKFKSYLESLFKSGEKFAEKIERGDVSPALKDALEKSISEDIVAGPSTTDKTFQLKGWPAGINTTAKKRTILSRLSRLADEGVIGRFWYEDSAKKIMELVNNDVVEAEKIVGLIALYSPQNAVNPNFKMAITAYIAYQNGDLEALSKIGRFPNNQSPKALSILETGNVPAGQKVNSFYQNLMWAINPSLNKPVTVDLWIMRAFGYTKDVPTELQYKTAEQEITKISNKLGWEPWQTQAAIWTSMKARYEAVKGEMYSEAKKKGIDTDSEAFKKKLLNKAFNTKEFNITKYDFADSAAENTGNIVMEAIPGLESGNLQKIIDAPYEVKQNYHYAMVKSLYDLNGVDAIADILGLGQMDMYNAVGAYKNQTNPLSVKPVINPYFVSKDLVINGKKVNFKNLVPDAIQKPLDAYMAMVGLLFQQDAMANSTFMKAPSKKASNSMNFVGTRHLSPEEMSQVTDALYEEFGVTDYVPIPLPNNTPGFAVVNWVDGRVVTEDKKINENYRQPWGGIENTEFHKKVKKVVEKVDIKDLNLRIEYFAQAGNLIEGGKNGKNYIRKIRESGQSDALWKFYNNTYQKINQINEGFSKKGYGKTKKLKKHTGKTFQLERLEKQKAPVYPVLSLQQKLFYKNSAVTKSTGNPIMVFHGTWLAETKEFPQGPGQPSITGLYAVSPWEVFEKTSDIGFHFGTRGQALSRIKDTSLQTYDVQRRINVGVPHIYNVFLNITNPLRMSDMQDFSDPDALHRFFTTYLGNNESLNRYFLEWESAIQNDAFQNVEEEAKRKYVQAWKNTVMELGYDGVVYKNRYERPSAEESLDADQLIEYREARKYVMDVISDVFDVNISYDEFNRQLGAEALDTPFKSYTNTFKMIEEKLGPEVASQVRDYQARVSDMDKQSVKDQNLDSYIAFNANQIKDINNQYPTDSDNISYQLDKMDAADYKRKKALEAAKNKVRSQDAKDKKREVADFIRKRRAYLDTQRYDLILWARELKELTTEKERELIPFLIEGTNVPAELNRPDLESMMADKEIIDRLMPVVKNVKTKYKQIWELLSENNESLTDKEIENYVTHVWDIPKNVNPDSVAQWFSIHNKFLQQRYISTLSEGITEFGLKPKMLDIADIVAVYGNIAYNTVANKKFVEDIRTIKKYGFKLISSDEVPGWKIITHPVMKKPFGGYYYIHPDIVNSLEVILGSRFDDPAISAFETLNGALKKLQLSISLFHHLALSETGVATIGPLKTLKIINPWSFVYRGFLKGDSFAWEKTDVVRDGLDHGLQLGASEDINVERIQGILDNFVRRTEDIPGIGNIASMVPKLLASFNEKWDRALWDWLHDGFKILGYEQLVSNLDPNISEDLLNKQKDEIAAFINDSFGGQNWDLLMVRPKSRQMMGWALLSPDWLTSTMRQFGSMFGIGAAHKETKKMRMKTGGMFWIKAGLYFGVGMNALNCLQRKWDYEENPQAYPEGKPEWPDCSMAGNTIGNQTYLFAGRNQDGTEKYIRWGKQFREFPELLYDDTGFSPVTAAKKKLGSKFAPVPQEFSILMTGSSISGYTARDLQGKKGWDWTLNYLKRLPTIVVPFSAQKKIKNALGVEDQEWYWTDIFMPSGKGMSGYKATELYKMGILEAIETGDPEMIKETYYACIKNQMDPMKPFKAAMSSISAEKSKAVNKLNKSIEDWTATLKEAIKNGDMKGIQRAKNKIKGLAEEKYNLDNYEATWEKMKIEFLKFQIKYPEFYKDKKLLPLE